ncbi:hypothetical protein A3H66_02425 [Candidatus Falkowbacteria bacterium RIFCSPLOWO2_02_FULL_45_21]|uniref:Uncharacterized protein n=1 Tax=Candidatus Falkowbacteria bacterium RIFCSPLOWO2_02_FULL_45_21 TaxID=1797989 RepID=A0A1F5SBC1_9BACT|nr:MAG: hypothetical protein A3H66_02425 [Candidatus Falkowbacteria bacterium RIFCSPLOWO2_02_FULL_45_21]
MADYRSGRARPDNFEIFQARFMALRETLKEKITPVTKQVIRQLLNNKLKIFLPQKDFNKKQYQFFA